MTRTVRSPLDYLAALCFAAFLLQGAGAIAGNSLTYDEGPHLAAGLYSWRTGDFRVFSVNPPLGRLWATLPLLPLRLRVPVETGSGVEMINRIGLDNQIPFHRLVAIARIPTLLLTLALGLLVFREARRGGPEAGLAAALLFCFQPMVLAHGSLATVEASAMLGFFAAAAIMIERGEKGWTAGWAAVAGAAAGAAFISKFVNISLLLVLPLLHLAGPAGRKRPTARGAGLVATGIVAALLVINAGYFFHQSFFRLSEVRFESRLRSVAALLPGWTRVPLPRQLVTGFDQQTRYNEENGGSRALTFRAGAWRPGPDHSFFFRLAAMKLTIPLLLLTFVAVGWSAGKDPTARRTRGWLIAAVGLFLPMTFAAGNYHTFRYVLPAVPALVAAAAAPWSGGRPGRRLKLVALAVLAASAVWTGVRTFPYYLPYNNAAFDRGDFSPDPDWCADWGQGLIALREWRAVHPEGKLYLAYAGSIDPSRYGIDWEAPTPERLPGYWAISRVSFFGPGPEDELVFMRGDRQEHVRAAGPIFGGMKGREPVAVLAGSIIVFQVKSTP